MIGSFELFVFSSLGDTAKCQNDSERRNWIQWRSGSAFNWQRCCGEQKLPAIELVAAFRHFLEFAVVEDRHADGVERQQMDRLGNARHSGWHYVARGIAAQHGDVS